MDIFGPLGWAVVVIVAIAILLLRDRFTRIYCPDCDADLPKGTSVCTFCGYDFQSMQRPSPKRPPGAVDLRLADDRGNSFELAVLNYQFPGIREDEWDSNWLLVRMEGGGPRSSWTRVDSCLLTWELSDLADWLTALGSDQPVEPEIVFTEPTLQLSSTETEGGRMNLAVQVVLETPQRPQPEDVVLTVTVDKGQLSEAAKSLSQALEHFPVRAGARIEKQHRPRP